MRQPKSTVAETVYGVRKADRIPFLKKLQEMEAQGDIMCKIYTIVATLGEDMFIDLPMEDQSKLALIRQFKIFKEWEIWNDIKAEIEAEEIKPTAPDRERLSAAICKCYEIAGTVKDEQAQLRAASYAELEEAERKLYEDMVAQHQAEAASKTYKRSRGTLTMKERMDAKLQKEKMLRNSFKPQIVEREESGVDDEAYAAYRAYLEAQQTRIQQERLEAQ